MKKDKEIKSVDVVNNSDLTFYNFKTFKKFIKENKLFIVVITIFTLLIYANIITGDFVNLDDYSKAFTSPEFHDFGLALKSFDAFTIVMSVVVQTFGINSSVFHIVSIMFHMLNGILVFILLNILFGKKISIIGTLLFIAHPANTEAISWHAGVWYAGRASIIIPTLIFFALFKKTDNKIYLLISTLIYVFSLIFYRGGGWILVTPFLLVLMDQFIIEKKIKFSNIKQYLPYLLTSLAFAIALLPGYIKERVQGLETLYYVDTATATPLINRIPYTIYMEYTTLFYPKTLSIYHEGKYITPAEYTFMVFLTFAVIFAIFYFMKKDRRISGLLLMIIFGVLPSFSPVIVAWIAAERYLYIPSIFSSAIIGIGLIYFENKINEKNKKQGKVKKGVEKNNFVLYASIIIISLYSLRTVLRNNDLRNSKNLWIASKKTAPYSYRVYNNMGDVLANEGDLEGALENFKRSYALKPDYADAVHNIGHIYMVQGNIPQAIRYLEQSLQMNPRLYPSAYKLGIIYMEEKDFENAKKYFEACLQYEPTSADCNAGLQTANQMLAQ
ncbi:MAG TPA: tetratricopeptide repeat protein [Patescibacteria group bacterium]|nr:tetratricopeptide repeat protein [bacterium]HRY56590.1 tetratricopeptide repeat protein [Patescibacteria group bacterium]